MTDRNRPGVCVLFLGPKWWGSDATALANAFRSRGCALIEIDYEDYLPIHWQSTMLRAVRRLTRPFQVAHYNQIIARHASNGAIDFVLVFKGMMLLSRTLRMFACAKYCFYPDVSFVDHGGNIWDCLPHYDCVFTTKHFHLTDPSIRGHVANMELVRHGADDRVHRRLHISERARRSYACDISFVGCWSPKKERLVAALIQGLPDADIRLWGVGWNRSGSAVRARWQGRGAYGDELALVYQCSRINLGLLSESGGGTSQGDETTARTWQIPAVGAFMIHERTPMLLEFFDDSRSVVSFEGENELVEQCRRFLQEPQAREAIAKRSHEALLARDGNTYGPAADAILRYHEKYHSQQQ